MDRAQLSHGHYFQVSDLGEIPLLDDYIQAVRRWAFSNPKRKGFLAGPKRVYDRRSNQQNKTVMGVWMDQILEEWGYEQEDKQYIYIRLKLEMGWTVDRVNTKTGEVKKVPRPTSDLDVPGYSKFMELFQRHMATKHEIVLLDPDKMLARI